MAKPRNAKGMHGSGDRKTRGRTTITKAHPKSPTRPNVPQEMQREATRPVNAGGTKQRGDRRDTSKVYTGKQKHASRGANPRPDVKTRKR